MSDKAEWLAKLQVGDPAIVQDTGIGGCRAGGLVVVGRFTATQIVTKDGWRYRRDSGSQIGGSAWHRGWLEEPTTEKLAAIRAYRLTIPDGVSGARTRS